MQSIRKGFTLIELLIVIGILAVLATVTILVLNPAQLFAESRDSQRITDLGTLNKALGFYMARLGSDPDMDEGGGACGSSFWATHASATKRSSSSVTIDSSVGVEVDGTGWVPIDFTALSDGSPIAALPNDPSNSATNNYQYHCADGTTNTYELNTIMESTRYANGGDDDVESVDGGDNDDHYEIGTDPDLNL